MAVDPGNRRAVPAGAVATRGARSAAVQGHLVGSVPRIKSRIVSRMNSAGVIPLVCAVCWTSSHSGSEMQPLKRRLCPGDDMRRTELSRRDTSATKGRLSKLTSEASL